MKRCTSRPLKMRDNVPAKSDAASLLTRPQDCAVQKYTEHGNMFEGLQSPVTYTFCTASATEEQEPLWTPSTPLTLTTELFSRT